MQEPEEIDGGRLLDLRESTIRQDARSRCSWAEGDPLMLAYHDAEWGVPEYDSRALWEKLMLDGFQAGLSWSIILRKREAFRKAFKNFDPAKVARFGERDVARLLDDAGIVRSRAKIEAAIGSARAYLEMREAGEDFSAFVWDMTGGKPLQNRGEILAQSPLSEEISTALKKRGFKFVGPVIVYAWMQAVGIVNDHASDCFRRKAVRAFERKP
jgi:DNA-3-methyladenine glycosylase I